VHPESGGDGDDGEEGIDTIKEVKNINFHEVYPRSLFSHTRRSNVDGFVTALPSLVMIIGSDFLIAGFEGVFGDLHAVRCSLCMASMEIVCLLTAHGFNPP